MCWKITFHLNETSELYARCHTEDIVPTEPKSLICRLTGKCIMSQRIRELFALPVTQIAASWKRSEAMETAKAHSRRAIMAIATTTYAKTINDSEDTSNSYNTAYIQPIVESFISCLWILNWFWALLSYVSVCMSWLLLYAHVMYYIMCNILLDLLVHPGAP